MSPESPWFSRDQNFLNESDLPHSHTMTPFDAPGKKSLKDTIGKGEIARNK